MFAGRGLRLCRAELLASNMKQLHSHSLVHCPLSLPTLLPEPPKGDVSLSTQQVQPDRQRYQSVNERLDQEQRVPACQSERDMLPSGSLLLHAVAQTTCGGLF